MIDPLSALRDRVELLEEEFKQFRDSFKPNPIRFFTSLYLSRTEAIVADALSNGAVWSTERLLARLDTFMPQKREESHSEEFLRIVIHRIRKKFKTLEPPLVISNIYGLGYQLSPESIRLLAARRIS